MTNWLSNWQEDIAWLAAELPRRHLNLFHNLPEQTFLDRISRLQAELPECDGAMVITRLMAIVAAIGDAHTTVIPTVNHYLPFEFYWFAEGLHIVAARPEHQEWLAAKVTAIENLPIDEVSAALTGVLAHENKAYVASLLPFYLAAADLLYGLEICDSPDQVLLSLQKQDGTTADLSVPTASLKDWTSSLVRLGAPNAGQTSLPLYRQHLDQSFWFTPVGSDSVYVQYNACREQPDCPMTAVGTALLEFIADRQPQKIILDLRLNRGGDSTLLEPLIDELARQPARYFVIIGRNTFSSALLNAYALKERTGAMVVGEPSGGKPNCYGEVKYLTLPHSRLQVRYSTKYYHLVADDALLSLMPDLPCPVTLADYLAGLDPCLEAIRSQ